MPYGTTLNSNFIDLRNDPWPWHPATKEQEHDSMDKTYTPTLDAFYNSRAPWTFPPYDQPTPLGNQLGLQDILKMLEIQRLLGAPQALPK